MKHRLKHSIAFGRSTIDFHLIFGEHDKFRVVVSPDLRVEVHAPSGKSLDQVLNRVKSKASWISRQVRYFERYQPRTPEKRYVSGETYKYLGRQYRLRLIAAKGDDVKLSGGFLSVRTRDKGPEYVKGLVRQWYKGHAQAIFEKRLARCMERGRRRGIPKPVIRVRRMSGRWGSCLNSGAILLNAELVQAPVHCIDYVITHELCHALHRNHSAGFYRLLARMMPDWEVRKQRLEEAVLI